MAIIPFVKTVSHDGSDATVIKYVWSGLTAGDEGEAIALPSFADRSIQVGGEFGVGGAVTIKGSIITDQWDTLSDPQGNPLVFSGPKIETITEMVELLKPMVAGDGTTAVTIAILVRKV